MLNPRLVFNRMPALIAAPVGVLLSLERRIEYKGWQKGGLKA